MKKSISLALAIGTALALASPVSAITNGEVDTTTDWVGAMTGVDPGGTQRMCSGSLIGDGVFLTAGHCGVLTDVEILFGDVLDIENGVNFEADTVDQHPDYTHNFGNQFDVAVVTFDQGDDVLPMGAVAPASYIDGFSKAELKTFTFDTYGYGLNRDETNGNSMPLASDSVRRSATQTYLNQHNQYLGLSIHNNKGNGGGCFGDSGGPHVLNDFIVSVTSNGDGKCVATDNTQRVDQPIIRDWILSFIS